MSSITFKNVYKKFGSKESETVALNDVSFSLKGPGLVSIIGRSGSGKSTLLNLLTGIEKPTNGKIIINDKNISKFSSNEWQEFRREQIGIIFQHYNLFEDLTVWENVILPLQINGISNDEINARANKYLNDFNLTYIKNQKVALLSGGEKQRVSIIRVLISEPDIILCDEPTGALDKDNSILIMDIIKNISLSKIVLLVSHNVQLVQKYSDRIITLSDGKIIKDMQISTEIFEHSFDKKENFLFEKHKWQRPFVKSYFKKNFLKYLFSFTSCVCGITAIYSAVGFSNSVQETSELAMRNSLEYFNAKVSMVEKFEIKDSPLVYEKNVRPDLESLSFLVQRFPSLKIEPNFEYYIPQFATIKVDKNLTKNTSVLPLNESRLRDYDKSSIIEVRYDSDNYAYVNEMFYEKYLKSSNSRYINLSYVTNVSLDSFSNNEQVKKDLFSISCDLFVKGIVKEFSFLNTPKVYYSQNFFENLLKEYELPNISEELETNVNCYDFILNSNDDSLVSSFSYNLFFDSFDDIEELNLVKEELTLKESKILISSSILDIKKTYIDFMRTFASSLDVFVIISFIGVNLILGINSYSVFVESKKESAILTILGAKVSEIIKIYYKLTSIIVLGAFILSAILISPISKILNAVILKTTGLSDSINVPFFIFKNVPFLLPVSVFGIVFVVAILFTIIPLIIYKKIPLQEELRDE